MKGYHDAYQGTEKDGGPGAEALAGGAASGVIVLVGRARLLVLPEIVRHVHNAPPRLRVGTLTSDFSSSSLAGRSGTSHINVN